MALNAMNVEMQSMKDNEVWILVELPPNGKTVGSKWLFKKKTDMDGAVHTYKARLVAKGYTQTPWIDYEETFSPVADIRAIKDLIGHSRVNCINLGNKNYRENQDGDCLCQIACKSVHMPRLWVLLLAVRVTRPDVSFRTEQNKPIQQNPGESSLTYIKNILKYLSEYYRTCSVLRGDLKTRSTGFLLHLDAGYWTYADDLKSQTG
ncbi:retrotransposon protein, putative, ty1-copia subclass [Tanacetum coccineum]